MRAYAIFFPFLLGAAALPAKPSGLTVKPGETWIFAIQKGQPAKARRADVATIPAPGEMKVSVRAMMGTSMSVTNHSRYDYAYRATLVLPDGKGGPVKSCAVPANGRTAFEHWTQAVTAVRLSDFKSAPAGSLCP